jgi:Domain of unknown function (DUF4129)
MESNAGSRPLRPLLTLVGVLVSVAIVAVASRGSLPLGEEGGRRPTDTLVDLLFTLYVLMLAVGAVFFVYLFTLQRRLKRQSGIDEVSPLSKFVFLAIVLIGLLFVGRLNGFRRRAAADEPFVPTATPPPGQPATPQTTDSQPEFAWIPATAFLVLLIAGAFAVWWAGRRRGKVYSPREKPLGEALADVLEETLDDVRAEQDPRRAVLRAYGRLERVLAAHGLPRRPSDAPLEYLARVLNDLSVSPDAVRRLTALFERAKFSQHEIGVEMKDEAVAALQTMQDELRAAEALARQERERAERLVLEQARAGR